MDHTYFFVHHLPCSYRCSRTMEFAKKIEERISEVEPEFSERTIEFLKKPLLVFAERDFVIFNGELSKNSPIQILEYSDCEYLKNPARLEESIDFFDTIKSGNRIVVDNDKITIKDDNSILKIINKKPEWFVIDFD